MAVVDVTCWPLEHTLQANSKDDNLPAKKLVNPLLDVTIRINIGRPVIRRLPALQHEVRVRPHRVPTQHLHLTRRPITERPIKRPPHMMMTTELHTRPHQVRHLRNQTTLRQRLRDHILVRQLVHPMMRRRIHPARQRRLMREQHIDRPPAPISMLHTPTQPINLST